MATPYHKSSKKKQQKIYVKYVAIVVLVVIGVIFLAQVFYPSSNLPLGVKIGGENLGGWNKKAAIKELDRIYNSADVEVFLGESEDSYTILEPGTFGLEVDNTMRINSISYPWYIRAIPTSLFWWGAMTHSGDPSLQFDDIDLKKFIEKRFGAQCYIQPRNATLTIEGSSISVGKSSIGGSCRHSVVAENFRDIEFVSSNSGVIYIDLNAENPSVSTADATELAMDISPNLIDDLLLQFDEMDDTVTVDRDELVSWISFEVVDHELTIVIDKEKSSIFYKNEVASLVEHNAGVTTIIATEDASAVRIDGAEGRMINVEETNLRISEYLRGLRLTVVVAVESTDPSITYVYNRLHSNQNQEDALEDEEVEQDVIDEESEED